MKFTTTAGALRDALGTARAAMVSNPSLVAYSGVLLKVKGKSLSVIGSDAETTIAALLEVSDAGAGQVLLPPKPLAAFLATLPAEDSVAVTASDGGDVDVEAAGTPPYHFRGLSATFPMPNASKMDMSPVNFERLADALAAVRAAAGRDEPIVQVVSDADTVVLNATDSYRIGQATLTGAGFGEFSGVLPMAAVERMARHGIDHIGVDTQGRTLRGTGPGIVIMSRLLQAPFPAVESVLVDQRPEPTCDVNVAELLAAVRRLSAIADTSPLTVSISGVDLELSVSNIDLGSGREVLKVSRQVPFDISFAVNLGYLRDAVDAHPCDVISIGFAGAERPVFLTSNGDLSVTSVVMPIRV